MKDAVGVDGAFLHIAGKVAQGGFAFADGLDLHVPAFAPGGGGEAAFEFGVVALDRLQHSVAHAGGEDVDV